MLFPVALLVLSAEIIVAPPRLPTVATLERIPLHVSPGGVSLTVLPFEKRLEIRSNRDSRAIYAKIVATSSRLCPQVQLDPPHVTLTCRSRRLDGALVDENGKVGLEIYELRGVPWKGEENRINIFYGPIAFKVDEACPGTSPLSRGECAFQAGQYAVAAVEFRQPPRHVLGAPAYIHDPRPRTFAFKLRHRPQVLFVRRARRLLDLLHSHGRRILPERLDVPVGVVTKRNARLLRTSDRPVVNVRKVHDLTNLVAAVVLESASEDIQADEGPEVPDVASVIDCEAAGIHPHGVVARRCEWFLGPCQSVVQAQHGGCRSSSQAGRGQLRSSSGVVPQSTEASNAVAVTRSASSMLPAERSLFRRFRVNASSTSRPMSEHRASSKPATFARRPVSSATIGTNVSSQGIRAWKSSGRGEKAGAVMDT